MSFANTALPGVVIFEPRIFTDDRGYFYESYNADLFRQAGIEAFFVQDNESGSTCGVVRGLHYQRGPHAQGKLVRVVQGAAFDVVADVRRGSPTFGKWIALELSAENRRQVFVPRGYAHGFLALSNEVVLLYKCDNFYAPEAEAGIRFDDPLLNIAWPYSSSRITVSAKDGKLPYLQDNETAAPLA